MREPPKSLNHVLQVIGMQRMENRSRFRYTDLEASLPREVRSVIEEDWRTFIRSTDGENFTSAFEKAVLKNFPGVFRLIEAVEYLYGLPFHFAAAYLFGEQVPQPYNIHIDDGELFAFTERLRELRLKHHRPKPDLKEQRLRPIAERLRATTAGGAILRICAICGKPVSHAEVPRHIQTAHRSWLRVSEEQRDRHRKISIYRGAPPERFQSAVSSKPHPVASSSRKQIATIDESPLSDRSASGRCIFCGHRSMPGEHTCYACSPD